MIKQIRHIITLAFVLSIVAVAQSFAADPVLEIIDANGNTTPFDMESLKAMPHVTVTTETEWTTPGKKAVFTGVLLRDLLKKTGVDGVEVLSYAAANDYAVEIPTSDAMKYDVILAYEQDGAALDNADKGPLWVMYPYSDHEELKTKVYYSRAIWQLRKIKAE